MKSIRLDINDKLINWYLLHKRDLPWRNTHDPYKIWISEIILQQTRVIQGLEYYNRFIKRFPDIRSLAEAEEQEVLKYWQGLGYYSRARNIHFTAKNLLDKYKGEFPKDYNSILKLKGIGDYTAAAITSFSWNMPHPTVDGNVFRFLSRLYAIASPIDTTKGKKEFTQLAGQLIEKSQAGLFNQAIMEFGALQCTPNSPDCSSCPFKEECIAYNNHLVEKLPVKQNKTKTKKLYLYYFHIQTNHSVFIKKRVDKGIWQNLFEFPVITSETILEFDELICHPIFQSWFPDKSIYDFNLVIDKRKHILSHRELYASFFQVKLTNEISDIPGLLKIKEEELDHYPIHRLMQYYLDKEFEK